MRLCIATDFSVTPGPRLASEGKWSGEEFLNDHLRPRFQEACGKGEDLLVDLDGVEGYATSFLEASFGQLSRENGSKAVLDRLSFKSNDEPYLVDEIIGYIKAAKPK